MQKIIRFVKRELDDVTPLALVILISWAVYALCFILPFLLYFYYFVYLILNSLFDLSTYYHPSNMLADFNPFAWALGPTVFNIFAVIFNIILFVCIALCSINLIMVPIAFVVLTFSFILRLIFKQSFLDNFGEFSLGFLFAPYIYIQILFPELAQATKARYLGCGTATILYIVIFITWINN